MGFLVLNEDLVAVKLIIFVGLNDNRIGVQKFLPLA